MKKVLIISMLAIFISCNSGSKTGDLIHVDATVFEIKGNGEQLNLPIFSEYARVDEIEKVVLEGEKVYESLANLYDFKEYTLAGRGSITGDYFTGEKSRKGDSAILTFMLENVELEIIFDSFVDNRAVFQVRFERDVPGKARDVRYQNISVEPGQSVSVGTITDQQANTGVILALSFNHKRIDESLTAEDIFKTTKGNDFKYEDLTYRDLSYAENIAGKFGLKTLTDEVLILKEVLIVDQTEYSRHITLKPITPGQKYYPISALRDSVSGKVKIAVAYNSSENKVKTSIIQELREDMDIAAEQYVRSQKLSEIFKSNKPGFTTWEVTVIFDNKKLTDQPSVRFIPYDIPPKPMSSIRPEYPKSMQESKTEGVVIVQTFIRADSTIGDMVILKEAHPDLNAAALDALRETKWIPAMYKNEPVGVWISIPINFKIKDQK